MGKNGGEPMRLLCAMAAVGLAVTSMGCQAINTNRLANNGQITQASYNSPALAGQQAIVDPAVAAAAFCGDACGPQIQRNRGPGLSGVRPLGNRRPSLLGGFSKSKPFHGCGSCVGDGSCGSGGACGSCDGCHNGNECVNRIVSKVLDCRAGGDRNYNFQPGPPAAQTAYPYYSVRGPRDFLAREPRPIGPNDNYGCRF